MAQPSLVLTNKKTSDQAASPDGVHGGAAAVIETELYAADKKIYPRAVSGWFAAWRWALVWATQLAFYGGAWLTWNDRQAILFDVVHRKFYIFGLVFWPQDIIYLAVLLIIAALSLFLFTAVAGRLWCGYACPQTVYTEIFMWIERVIEGDRLRRMKLDRGGLSARKIGLKAAKHAAWIALALWTGFTFVGYVTPIRELWGEVVTLSTGPWETFWMLFYGFATYGNAGWMREQVCIYMCPYARFQSAMFDRDTLIITYDRERGEPRGPRARSAARRGAGPRALRGLRHLRPGLPHGHRHPQRPAVPVHRLRRVHRRLRPGDGQDGLPARPHPLFHPERDRAEADGDADAGAHVQGARARLLRDRVGGDHRGRDRPVCAGPAQGGRHSRPRGNRARGRGRRHRERVPVADHQHLRAQPRV